MSERTTEEGANGADPPDPAPREHPPETERAAPEPRPSPSEEHLRARQTFVRGLRDVERWGFEARSNLMTQRTALERARLPEGVDACDIEAYIAGSVLVRESRELADAVARPLRSVPFLLDPRTKTAATRLFGGVRDVTPDFFPWMTQVFQRCIVIHELTNVLLEESRHLEDHLASWKAEHLDDVDAATTIAAHVSTSLPFAAISALEADVERETRPFSATWRGLFRSKRVRERLRLRRFAEAGLQASIERGARTIEIAPFPALAWPE